MRIREYYHTLSPTRTERHRLWGIRAALCLIVGIGAALVVRQLLFPTYQFTFHAAVDSLANTISRPFETAAGTAMDVGAVGRFTVARVAFTLPQGEPALPAGTTLSLHHTYAALLAPFANDKYHPAVTTVLTCDDTFRAVTADNTVVALPDKDAADSYLFANRLAVDTTDPRCTPTDGAPTYGFRSGTLIASADSVFVTEDLTMRPFQDTLSFDAMGYDFDNVISTTATQRAPYVKARRLDIGGVHPSGTLFYAADTDNTYVTDQSLLYKIPNDLATRRYAITAAEASRATVATCTLQRSLLSPRTYHCRMALDTIADFPGNTFRFTIGAPSVAVDRAKITLTTAISMDALRYRFRMIKNDLTNAYAPPTR